MCVAGTYLIEHLGKCLVIGHYNRRVVVFDVLVHDTASLAHAQTIRGLAAVLVALNGSAIGILGCSLNYIFRLI